MYVKQKKKQLETISDCLFNLTLLLFLLWTNNIFLRDSFGLQTLCFNYCIAYGGALWWLF